MGYKIIATDFDGTLLTSNKRVTQKTKNTLLKLKNNQYTIAGVTARNLSSVKKVCDINMFDYLILNNGCYLYDVEKAEGNYIRSISEDIITKITTYFKKIAQGIDYISSDKYYMYRKNGRTDFRDFIVEVEDNTQINDKISRMNIFAQNEEEAWAYKKYIDDNFNEVDCIVMQDTDNKKDKRWVAINPKNQNKYTTLEMLCDDLKVSTDEAIFFGDSTNDIEIIENVGLGVAMGNALKQVKAKAKTVTLSNDEDGVAVFLESI